jgi:hypothetical protein
MICTSLKFLTRLPDDAASDLRNLQRVGKGILASEGKLAPTFHNIR